MSFVTPPQEYLDGMLLVYNVVFFSISVVVLPIDHCWLCNVSEQLYVDIADF